MDWYWGGGTSLKDYIKENGFELTEDIIVRCNKCGKIHVFKKDDADPQKWLEEADMGIRTDYTFLFEGKCDRCQMLLECKICFSEYPSGTMEGGPSIECVGCYGVNRTSFDFQYYDYEVYMQIPEAENIIIPQNYTAEIPVLSAGLCDGDAFLRVEKGELHKERRIRISSPHKELFDILVDETNVIRFDANRVSLA